MREFHVTSFGRSCCTLVRQTTLHVSWAAAEVEIQDVTDEGTILKSALFIDAKLQWTLYIEVSVFKKLSRQSGNKLNSKHGDRIRHGLMFVPSSGPSVPSYFCVNWKVSRGPNTADKQSRQSSGKIQSVKIQAGQTLQAITGVRG